jgi:hypothetical protein
MNHAKILSSFVDISYARMIVFNLILTNTYLIISTKTKKKLKIKGVYFSLKVLSE